ncbi:MAG: DUF2141 domain-containing protein [Gammaproteobacteria bacterium]|nr:DUF2141 domain-containing protein [Gammaproteobacteria bacterium]
MPKTRNKLPAKSLRGCLQHTGNLLLSLLLAAPLYAADLKISIQGAQPQQGFLRLGLFDKPDGFPAGKPAHGRNLEVEKDETVTTKFTDLPPGRYALAVFQDKNGNKKLDTNFFGVPKELYGFSHIDKAGEPEFEEAAFELTEAGAAVVIQLR